nr:MAG TPA: hypothetical protein [Caudoviricetes sp.]
MFIRIIRVKIIRFAHLLVVRYMILLRLPRRQ